MYSPTIVKVYNIFLINSSYQEVLFNIIPLLIDRIETIINITYINARTLESKKIIWSDNR